MNRLSLLTILFLATYSEAADLPKPVGDLKAHKEFALELERAIRVNDREAFEKLLDTGLLSERIFKMLSAPDDFQKGAKKAFSTLADRFLGELARQSSQIGCGVKLLRVRMVDGEPRALFRCLVADGLNYIDFVLSTPKAGTPIRICDAYVTITGEYLSETMASLMVKGVAASQTNQAELADQTKKLLAMAAFVNLVRTGETEKALEAYEALPEDTKQSKVILLMHVVARARLFEEDPIAYEKSIDAFINKFPNDPAVELVALDKYFLKEKYADLQKAIDRLDKSVGGDPYLHILRGHGLRLDGKSKEGKAAIRRAIELEPDLTAAYLTLANIALEENDFQELAKQLTIMESKLGHDFSGVFTAEEYADFRRSPEFRDWAEQRNTK